MSSDFKPGDAVAQQVQRIPRSGIREFFDLVQEAKGTGTGNIGNKHAVIEFD